MTDQIRAVDPRAMVMLKVHRGSLTWQQYKTLRGQVLAGDAAGAMKGLRNILGRDSSGKAQYNAAEMQAE